MAMLIYLTLLVRRYLVPTIPAKREGGGGVELTPMISKAVSLYNLKLWQAIMTICEK